MATMALTTAVVSLPVRTAPYWGAATPMPGTGLGMFITCIVSNLHKAIPKSNPPFQTKDSS